MYRIKKLLSRAFQIVGLIQLLRIQLSMSGGAGRQMDPQLQAEISALSFFVSFLAFDLPDVFKG